jgi:predicted RND superfamily exporter protein
VAFGIGVDGAIYVVWTVLVRGGKFDWKNLPVSARAVFGSTLTTLVVFASLGTSGNGGLASLGQVGTLALFVTLLANLVWLPAALSWLNQMADARRVARGEGKLEPQS